MIIRFNEKLGQIEEQPLSESVKPDDAPTGEEAAGKLAVASAKEPETETTE